ncbi:MAG: peptide deformylase [Elusimicrobiota bacterium]
MASVSASTGKLLPIRKYGDKILRRPARRVKDINEGIRGLINDMLVTMINARGVGLAANQVGHNLQILVADLSAGQEGRKCEPVVLINPAVIKKKGRVRMEEGCLSFPGLQMTITRAKWIKVSAMNLNGVVVEIETEGFPARILQHEIDHLNNKLIIDHMPLLKKLIIWREIRKRRKTKTW